MVGCDGKPRQNETWWDDVVDCAIKEKNYGKSGKKVEVYFRAKKDIFKQKKKVSKQKRRQSQLLMHLGKVHKKPNLVIFKSMINGIFGYFFCFSSCFSFYLFSFFSLLSKWSLFISYFLKWMIKSWMDSANLIFFDQQP